MGATNRNTGEQNTGIWGGDIGIWKQQAGTQEHGGAGHRNMRGDNGIREQQT